MGTPAGYSQYSLPTMGGEHKQIYDLLRNQFMEGAPDIYSQLRSQAAGKPNAALEGGIQQKYQEEIIPQIASAFGLSGTHKGSGFQGQVARQGRNLAGDLASQRAQMQQDAIQSLLGLGRDLLGTQTEQFGLAKNPQQGFGFQDLLGPGGEALGNVLKDIIGKPGTDEQTGETGTDWGSIAGNAAKYLPLLLSLL